MLNKEFFENFVKIYFGQTSYFSPKIEIFVKNQNFDQNKKYYFSIVLDARVSIVTVAKLVDVRVTGGCKCP